MNDQTYKFNWLGTDCIVTVVEQDVKNGKLKVMEVDGKMRYPAVKTDLTPCNEKGEEIEWPADSIVPEAPAKKEPKTPKEPKEKKVPLTAEQKQAKKDEQTAARKKKREDQDAAIVKALDGQTLDTISTITVKDGKVILEGLEMYEKDMKSQDIKDKLTKLHKRVYKPAPKPKKEAFDVDGACALPKAKAILDREGDSKSSKMRDLHDLEYSKSDIAAILSKHYGKPLRYQFVNNVLGMDSLKKQIQAAKEAVAPEPEAKA